MICLLFEIADEVILLRPFLEHYYRLGVEKFITTIVNPNSEQLCDQIKDIVQKYNVTIHQLIDAIHNSKYQNLLRNEAQRKYCKPKDWILIADLDEFHEYPCQMPNFLENCEKKGINCIYANFIDRVTKEGILKKFNVQEDIFSQYPYGTFITRDILKAPPDKIIAFKGDFFPSDDHYTRSQEVKIKIQTKAMKSISVGYFHHFKWNSLVIKRLKERASYYKKLFEEGDRRYFFYNDSYRFINHYKKYNRIKVEDLDFRFLGQFDERRYIR